MKTKTYEIGCEVTFREINVPPTEEETPTTETPATQQPEAQPVPEVNLSFSIAERVQAVFGLSRRKFTAWKRSNADRPARMGGGKMKRRNEDEKVISSTI